MTTPPPGGQRRRSGSGPGADPEAPRGRGRRVGLRLHCRGVVQGVGFRPAVARLAAGLGLEGCLANVPAAVRIELVGSRPALQRFLEQLPANLPAAARLEPLQPEWLAPPLPVALADARGLRITAAAPQPLGVGLVAPSLLADRAPCRDCLRELRDPANRRHGYPFISCCSCGPRYAIATAEPFCRAHTTLAGFPLCPACQAEFDDPGDRRFHAETLGCPACGPRLRLLDGGGLLLAGPSRSAASPSASASNSHGLELCQTRGGGVAAAEPDATPPLPGDPLAAAVKVLRAGGILALQGVGGFQLLVNAADAAAVARLRQRKRRPHKPFALLVDSPERLHGLVHPSPQELAALQDAAAPIVLLPSPVAVHGGVLAEVAPGAAALGVMLPASPLHQLLAEAFAGPLVATSGNRSGEPLCTDPAEALARLSGIADVFLVHDRPIARPLDDSVLQLIDGRPALLRRARGYAPEALALPLPDGIRFAAGRCSSAEASRSQQISTGGMAAAGCGALPEPPAGPPHGSMPPARSLASAAGAAGVWEAAGTGGTWQVADDGGASGARQAVGGDRAAGADEGGSGAGASGGELKRAAVLLALGSDLRSAPALAVGDRLWLAPHLGDLADSRCLERWRAGIDELLKRQAGAVLAVGLDGHPEYLSHQLASALLRAAAPTPLPDPAATCQQPSGRAQRRTVIESSRNGEACGRPAQPSATVPDQASPQPAQGSVTCQSMAQQPALQPVAHHRAHGLAVAAEHGLALPLPALVLDGLGYGGGPVPLWGCELLWLEPGGARRLASLRPFPLPGGERAVREPRRSALGLLWAAGLIDHPGAVAVRAGFEAGDLAVLIQALRSGCNSPWCSSAGRLFDAVAALLDLVQIASHDSHAGLLLQAAASQAPAAAGAYPLPWRQDGLKHGAGPGSLHGETDASGELPPLPLLDWQPLLMALLHDIASGCSQDHCAARFHAGLVAGLAEAVTRACLSATGDDAVAAEGKRRPGPSPGLADAPGPAVILAGGCFQNRLLLEGLIAALRRRGLRPFWGERIPLNDGGLAVGQILALQQAGLRPARLD